MFVSEDGSVYRDDETAIFFSIVRFTEDIVQGDHCFLCGRSRTQVEFNDEHVISDWILRKHNLHNRNISLPNGTLFRYSQYKVPCCKQCNSSMGKLFEEPMSELFNAGYDAVAAFISTKAGRTKLFVWLALIYLKTHLKDLALRIHRDARQPDERIADMYDWDTLHHVHCVARSFISGASIDENVLGSLVILPATSPEGADDFDYGDNYRARTMFVKIGEVAIVAVLNDAGTSIRFRTDPKKKVLGHPLLSAISRPLSPMQVREVMAELAYINLRIDNRPTFLTSVDPQTEECNIEAIVPVRHLLVPGSAEFYGALLYSVCENTISMLPEPTRSSVREQTLSGYYSFLWSPDGTQLRCDI
jgi:hypothetical protein